MRDRGAQTTQVSEMAPGDTNVGSRPTSGVCRVVERVHAALTRENEMRTPRIRTGVGLVLGLVPSFIVGHVEAQPLAARAVTRAEQLSCPRSAMARVLETSVGLTIRCTRRIGATTLACDAAWGANYDPCWPVSREIVRKVDAAARKACADGEAGVPHAIYGDADLDYRCVAGKMVRLPYSEVFDAEGYNIRNWKAVR
jgi:hypothetical protein